MVLALAALLFLVSTSALGKAIRPEPHDFTVAAGASFTQDLVVFTAVSGKDPGPGDFTATIDWSDGTPIEPGTVDVADHCPPGGCQQGAFRVLGTHTYTYGGTYDVVVRIRQGSETEVVAFHVKATVTGNPPPAGQPTPTKQTIPPKASAKVLTSAPSDAQPTVFLNTTTPGTSSIVKTHWDFGDGASLDKGLGENVAEHQYANANKTYTVTITVTDEDGATDTATVPVSVKGHMKPVITLDKKKGKVNSLFVMRGNLSQPTQGAKIVRYEWFCDKKLVSDSADPAHPSPIDRAECKFSTAGGGSATLRITQDDGATATASESVWVNGLSKPTASYSVAGQPEAGFAMTFDASASKPGPNSEAKKIDEYRWDFHDGSPKVVTTQPVIQHTFPEQGTYYVYLQVKDAEGEWAAAQDVAVRGACQQSVKFAAVTMATPCARAQPCQPGSKSLCFVGEPDVPAKMAGITLRPSPGNSVSFQPDNGHVGVCCFGTDNLAPGQGLDLDFLGLLTVPNVDFYLPTGLVVGDLKLTNGLALNGVLGSLGIDGNGEAYLHNGTTVIEASLRLPSPLDYASAKVKLVADNENGLHLGGVQGDLTDLYFGPFTVNKAGFSYDEPSDTWGGYGEVDVPGQGTFGGSLAFVKGTFNHLDLYGDSLNIAVGEGVFLQRIAGGWTGNPFQITAGAGFTAGPQLNVPFVGNVSLVRLDSNLQVTVNDDGSWNFGGTATGSLLSASLPTLNFGYESWGHLYVGAHYGVDLLDTVSLDGDVNFDYWGSQGFQLDALVNGCIHRVIHECASVELVVSHIGIAACGHLPDGLPNVGVWYRWGEDFSFYDNIYFHGCGVGKVKAFATAAAAQAGARDFVVGDVPSQVLAFTGTDRAPDVILTDPSGRQITTPASELHSDHLYAVKDAETKTTWFFIAHPAKGTWHATLAPGSATLTAFRRADGLPEPKVTARVGGSGTRRTLSYRISGPEKQAVAFYELGKGGKLLGRAKGRRGTLRFAPGDGPKGARAITAEITQDGVPRKVLKVATFTSPRIGPAAPRRARAVRRGAKVALRWSAADKVEGYEVQVRIKGGGRFATRVPARTRRLTVPGVRPWQKVTLKVYGLRKDARGSAATVTVKAKGKRPRVGNGRKRPGKHGAKRRSFKIKR